MDDRLIRLLDELARWGAGALERGEVASVEEVTRHLEELVGAAWPAGDPAPVVARRLARAHRLLRHRAGEPEVIAAVQRLVEVARQPASCPREAALERFARQPAPPATAMSGTGRFTRGLRRLVAAVSRRRQPGHEPAACSSSG